MFKSAAAILASNLVALLWMVLLGLSAVSTAGPSVAQQTNPGKDFATKVKNAVLMDGDSGGILYRLNSEELIAPASMSKLMTVAVAFRLLKEGKLQPGDEFEISHNAWKNGGAPSRTSAMMIPLKMKVRLDQLLQGIIIQSGNDAAIAVAEGIAGTEDAFARLMTEEARRIGLTKSQFRNPTGLYHPEHLMTVRELAVLARHIIREFPEYFPIFGQRDMQFRQHRFVNRNPLIGADANVDGMKTGQLKESGFSIVATAKVDGRRLIAVVSGAASANDRREEVRRLLNWGNSNVSDYKLFDPNEVVGQARVWGGSSLYVSLVGQGEVNVRLPRFPAAQRLRGEIVYDGPLKAPIQKGAEVARLRVTSSSNAVQEVPLYAAEDVGEASVVRRGLDSLAHMALRLFQR